jgi:(p)ppGpp synthase/HD superfamily hydrolase
MSKLVNKAKALAKRAHRGDTDRAGVDYFNGHLKAVVDGVRGEEEKAVAYLHDVVEDTVVTLEDVKDWLAPVVDADTVDRVVAGVDAMTKREYEPYRAYLARVKANDLARKVKIADLNHNADLNRLPEVGAKDIERRNKYKDAINYLK